MTRVPSSTYCHLYAAGCIPTRITCRLDERLEVYESAPSGQQPALLRNRFPLMFLPEYHKGDNRQGSKTLAQHI